METVTLNNICSLLLEINHRLKTMETEIQELKEPDIRAEYIKKLDEIEKQPSIYVGTVDNLKNRYKK